MSTMCTMCTRCVPLPDVYHVYNVYHVHHVYQICTMCTMCTRCVPLPDVYHYTMTLFKESEVATLLHIEGTWALLKEGNSSLETSWLERYEWEGCINLPKL